MPPTQKELYRLFFPLALSGAFFPVARPLINAALSRSPDPEQALAVFALALGITMPFVSPLFGLRQVTTALASDLDMVTRLRKLTLVLGCFVTVFLLTLSIPQVFDLTVQQVMGIPPAIAKGGPAILFILALSPLLSVGRGYYQGILVHFGKAGPIGTGAFGYLVSIALILAFGVWTKTIEGALLAALSLFIGQGVYLAIVWWPSRPIIRERIPNKSPDIPDANRSYKYLILFFLPIAIATILTALMEPAIQAGMARASLPKLSLAAYPVAASIAWLARTPLWNTQQVVISKATNYPAFCATRQFVLTLSLAMMLLLAIMGAPGIAHVIFGTLMGLNGQTESLTISGFRWLIPLAGLQGLRSLYYGALIRQNATRHIQWASVSRTIALFLGLAIGVNFDQYPGLFIVIWANLLSEAVEVSWLYQAVSRLSWPNK